VFDDLMTNWTDNQRSQFIADWENDEGLLDLVDEPREIPQEGLGMKRRREMRSETSNKRLKVKEYFTIKVAKQVNVRKFKSTG
jgi:hypothetical protein